MDPRTSCVRRPHKTAETLSSRDFFPQRLKPVLVQTAYAALKAPLFHTNPASASAQLLFRAVFPRAQTCQLWFHLSFLDCRRLIPALHSLQDAGSHGNSEGWLAKFAENDFRRHDEESDDYDDVVSFSCGGADFACGHGAEGEAGKQSHNFFEQGRGSVFGAGNGGGHAGWQNGDSDRNDGAGSGDKNYRAATNCGEADDRDVSRNYCFAEWRALYAECGGSGYESAERN